MIAFCPKCQAKIRVPSDHDPDDRLACPACDARFRVATRRNRDDEDEPDARRRARSGASTRRRRDRDDDDEQTTWTPGKILGTIGAGTLALGSIVVVVILATRGHKSDNTASTPTVQPEPAKPVIIPGRPGGAPNTPIGPDGLPVMPPEVRELFETRAETLAPTVFTATLVRPKDADFEMPSFATASRKQNPAANGTKLTLEEVKKAVVYIKLDSAEKSSTGSGFLVRREGDVGIVATNHHVVAPAALQQVILGVTGPRQASVKAVFDSGQPSELVRDATVIASDPGVDLALLRVTGVPKNIKPIEPHQATRATETLPVLICGFPLGQALSTAKRNPNITIGKGAVSSIRLNDHGEVARVQIDGAINPGNSGGPIVDGDGHLVGIAVSTFLGTGIGFAIPAEELISLLDGRLFPPLFMPVGVEGEFAKFRVIAVLSDPLRQVKSVSLLAAGSGTSAPARGADGLWPALPGATPCELKPTPRGTAEGDLRLPKSDRVVLIQLSCTYANGLTVRSRPVPYHLAVSGAQSAADTLPMNTLIQEPGRYTGQMVAVRGVVTVGGILRYTKVYQLNVENPESATIHPGNLTFLAPREICALLDELPLEVHQSAARITCLVGKRGTDGQTPIRVVSIGLEDRTGRVTKTLPYEPEDALAGLNAAPEKFVGQTVTVDGQLVPQNVPRGPLPSLPVMLSGGRPTQYLTFTCKPTLMEQVEQLGLDGELLSVRMRCQVEDSVVNVGPAGSATQLVTVTRIEILDPAGRSVKTLE